MACGQVLSIHRCNASPGDASTRGPTPHTCLAPLLVPHAVSRISPSLTLHRRPTCWLLFLISFRCRSKRVAADLLILSVTSVPPEDLVVVFHFLFGRLVPGTLIRCSHLWVLGLRSRCAICWRRRSEGTSLVDKVETSSHRMPAVGCGPDRDGNKLL